MVIVREFFGQNILAQLLVYAGHPWLLQTLQHPGSQQPQWQEGVQACLQSERLHLSHFSHSLVVDVVSFAQCVFRLFSSNLTGMPFKTGPFVLAFFLVSVPCSILFPRAQAVSRRVFRLVCTSASSNWQLREGEDQQQYAATQAHGPPPRIAETINPRSIKTLTQQLPK